MKNSKLSLTDLSLLRDLFAPGLEMIIIDPFERVVENVEESIESFQPDENSLNFVIDVSQYSFSCFLSNAQDDSCTSFDFINNADGTIRWFYNSNCKEAMHLSLYNSTSIKSKIYCTTLRTKK